MSAPAPKHLGRFLWREAMTKDLEKAKRFYGALFGWSFETTPSADDRPPYPMIQVNGRAVGGFMQMQPGMNFPPYWTSYASVSDVDASCAAAKASGGGVPWGPVDIPMAGRLAMVTAPDGACLSIMKASGPDELPPRAGVGEFCWETLSAGNVDAAKAFWTKVVPAWKAQTGAGGMLTFGVAEGMEQQVADVQPAQGPVPPNWLTYVVVQKLEPSTAKAEALGGKTLMGALAIPSIGRIAVIADDQGAALGLFEPAAR